MAKVVDTLDCSLISMLAIATGVRKKCKDSFFRSINDVSGSTKSMSGRIKTYG